MNSKYRKYLFVLCISGVFQINQGLAQTTPIEIRTNTYTISFSLSGEIEKIATIENCRSEECRSDMVYIRPDKNDFDNQDYYISKKNYSEYVEVIFRSGNEHDMDSMKTYRVYKNIRLVEAKIDLPVSFTKAKFSLSGALFKMEPSLSGIAAGYDRSRLLLIRGNTQTEIELDPGIIEDNPIEITTESWFGLRNRFSFLLVAPLTASLIVVQHADTSTLEIGHPSNTSLSYRLSFGEISENNVDDYPDKQFESMLYGNTWEAIKYICKALSKMLHILNYWLDNWGLSIIFFAIVIRVLLTPFINITDRLGDEYLKKIQQVAPLVDELKESYEGETLHFKIMALHKDYNIRAFDPFKPLLGLALQIPIFIAAFNMLANEYSLHQQTFLWIDDLSLADRFISDSVALAMIGNELNMLPIVMLLVSILSGVLFAEKIINTSIRNNERLKLISISILFFVLLYSFPASMVLYWITVNAMQLLSESIKLLRVKT